MCEMDEDCTIPYYQLMTDSVRCKLIKDPEITVEGFDNDVFFYCKGIKELKLVIRLVLLFE